MLKLNLQTVEEIEKSECETVFLKYLCDMEKEQELEWKDNICRQHVGM